jgi:hypothetical protein
MLFALSKNVTSTTIILAVLMSLLVFAAAAAAVTSIVPVVPIVLAGFIFCICPLIDHSYFY